ncbi:MAG TPA: ASPIC/UnbV domain-containing protein [Verrucomicrobiales bacterium]|nr:ASPIC/UnbV domain-containing protein [Verrucomicrobiales bacterium]
MTPEEIDRTAREGPRSAYLRRTREINDLIRSGGTLSGYERNCAFLNLGGDAFATVSALAGFDHLDDARPVALMDWDADGAVDVWTASRTSPRVRFLHNRISAQGNWIRLLLRGAASNRDAVGARVEIAGNDGLTRVRSVRAGEGFLAQSTRWIHAGLGREGSVARIRIRWPSGLIQEFREPAINRSYLITEGSSSLTPQPPPQQPSPEASDIPTAVPQTSRGRLWLSHRVPLPALPVSDGAGNTEPLNSPEGGRAQLLVLWAEWCVPCHAELQGLAAARDQLAQEGLEVVALHDSRTGGDRETAFLAGISFPHRSAAAAIVTTEILDQTVRNLLGMENPLPVPSSFLIAPGGWLAAVYLGETPLERILADRRRIDAEPSARLAAATPFPGIWLRPDNPSFHALYVPVTLLRHGLLDEAASLLRAREPSFVSSPNYPLVLGGLAERLLLKAGRAGDGIAFYRRSLELDPSNRAIMNNLAWSLSTHPDAGLRNGVEALRWARRAIAVHPDPSPGAYDTLAAALAETGAFADALHTAQTGLRLAQDRRDQTAVARLRHALELYREKKPQRSDPTANSLSP